MECEDLYDGTVVIHGSSDSRETSKGGVPISFARAEAVRTYLISTGVPAQSIQVKVVGDSLPVAHPTGRPEVDDYFHAQNRQLFGYVNRRPAQK
jgi:outer membrane protein OmpA-like peptidoglycan-associated protein